MLKKIIKDLELKKITFSKDDVIVLMFKERLEQDVAVKIIETVKKAFPENKIIVLDNGTDIKVLTKEEVK